MWRYLALIIVKVKPVKNKSSDFLSLFHEENKDVGSGQLSAPGNITHAQYENKALLHAEKAGPNPQNVMFSQTKIKLDILMLLMMEKKI